MSECTYLVNVNVSSGAFVPIKCKSTTKIRYMTIVEDGSGSAAGLVCNYNDGSSTPYGTNYQFAAGVPIQIGVSPISGADSGYGKTIGEPASPDGVRPATTVANVRSVGAATVVRVSEYS